MSLLRFKTALPLFRRTLSTSPRILYADPWPLPHTPEHMANTQSPSAAESVLPPIPRPNESIENTRARLLYQSRKRGTLESDLLLSTWATKAKLDTMTKEELKEYDQVRFHYLLYHGIC